MRKLGVSAIAYVAMVYTATAFSKQVVLQIGDAQCSDDWCLSVERVTRTAKNHVAFYNVTLCIFSRARRVAQREMAAKDVYLEDNDWRRYDPVLTGSEVPLNSLLQPGQSVTTSRTFAVPEDQRNICLKIDRSQPLVLPVCMIVGECGAFHKGTKVLIDRLAPA
jgi:hypothetical protein